MVSPVPAFQFLGVLPLAVMKASLSKLVEPQEQGNQNQPYTNIYVNYAVNWYTAYPGMSVRL